MLTLTLDNLILKGLLNSGSWVSLPNSSETINKIFIETYEGASCGSTPEVKTSFEVVIGTPSDYYTIIGDEITINPEAFYQTVAVKDGFYSIKVTIDTINGSFETANFLSYTLCNLIDVCSLKCAVAKKLETDIDNTDLVPLYQSILFATECNDCCTAFSLYKRLSDLVDECSSC